MENFKKKQEENIRAEREKQINRRHQIESMSFKDKAAVIKNKLVEEIYGRTDSKSLLTSENLKKNQIINDIRLNPASITSLPQSIKPPGSEYINQPPPIPRESLSNNNDNSNPQSHDHLNSPTLQHAPRRIYKRSDGSFVYFKKEKNSNIIRMIPVEQPFQNNTKPSNQNHSTS